MISLHDSHCSIIYSVKHGNEGVIVVRYVTSRKLGNYIFGTLSVGHDAWRRKSGPSKVMAASDLSAVYSISSEHAGHLRNCVKLC
jgi:hypothetical protein